MDILEKITNHDHVDTIRDDRKYGNSIIIFLKSGFHFSNIEDNCGVAGFITPEEALTAVESIKAL